MVPQHGFKILEKQKLMKTKTDDILVIDVINDEVAMANDKHELFAEIMALKSAADLAQNQAAMWKEEYNQLAKQIFTERQAGRMYAFLMKVINENENLKKDWESLLAMMKLQVEDIEENFNKIQCTHPDQKLPFEGGGYGKL